MTGPQRPEPVFMLAPPRSYSTVCLALLAGHPGIYGFPELLLFPLTTVGELLTEGQRAPDLDRRYVEARQSGPLRALAQVHEGSQSDAAIDRARAWLHGHAGWPVTRLFDHLLAEVAPRIGLEKSPDTIGSDQAVAACLAAYPRARFLHLTRHPEATQRSMHRHWQDLTHFHSRRQVIVAAASTWYLGHSRTVRTLSALPAERWLRVTAENLLREPRTWLPRILDWLDLPYDDAVLTRMLHTERWEYAGRGESGRLLGGDAVFMYHPALRAVPDPGPVAFDPAWGLPAEMCRRMTELAELLGYRTADA
ncbi:sulfotransferase family protein [Streptantibioticus rubrisoli]|uniref:Sulfotransferase n=1 Tax=Streptantibioticus rubrisoli TaxID=1387313 RepID=A0ABT1PBM5_9ACTN|nr:sulfotransferase [Streptantibioticus rubrisoli]MCQ4042785.1 sulfotransferase [Streptantibioticus rubrisoli]